MQPDTIAALIFTIGCFIAAGTLLKGLSADTFATHPKSDRDRSGPDAEKVAASAPSLQQMRKLWAEVDAQYS